MTEQAANADAIVDEAMAAGLDRSDRIVVSTKMFRSERLSVKADLEPELGEVVVDCAVRGRTVHYVGGWACGPDLGARGAGAAPTPQARALRRRAPTVAEALSRRCDDDRYAGWANATTGPVIALVAPRSELSAPPRPRS